MSGDMNRRTFLVGGAAIVTTRGGFAHARTTEPLRPRGTHPGTPRWLPHAEFPRQDPTLVREIVAVSHGNLERARELVEASPALAKARWDWGFGDWETALGAASHTGNRDIAELLIRHGARPTLFSAAMLGQIEVVRAFVQASPGVQRTPGPHGITLLAHARAGGSEASVVVEFLEVVGDADLRPKSAALSDEERRSYLGTYAYGSNEDERIEIIDRRGTLMFQRVGQTARGLTNLGGHEFHPAGAEAVRIRFAFVDGKADVVTVHDPDVIMTARRM